MTRYEKGRRFEWAVRDDLVDAGWSVVRAAGSKGNVKADLIAFHPIGTIALVQCKTDGKISASEWDRLVEVADWSGIFPILAFKGYEPKGIAYSLLTGPKIPRARTQPIKNFDPRNGS